MQLFAGELTNQNREYYKVNDNGIYSKSERYGLVMETRKCVNPQFWDIRSVKSGLIRKKDVKKFYVGKFIGDDREINQ